MISNKEIKFEVFKYYSKNENPCCNKCKINDIRVLCLDHKNSDGKTHRQEDNQARGINLYKKLYKNNFESKYEFQVLCFNCNIIKLIEEKEINYTRSDFWKENLSKIQKRIIRKKGKYSSRAKKVYQYDLDNNFIKEWDYIKEAEFFYNKNINSKNIVACCNNRQNTAYGYIWKHFKLGENE